MLSSDGCVCFGKCWIFLRGVAQSEKSHQFSSVCPEKTRHSSARRHVGINERFHLRKLDFAFETPSSKCSHSPEGLWIDGGLEVRRWARPTAVNSRSASFLLTFDLLRWASPQPGACSAVIACHALHFYSWMLLFSFSSVPLRAWTPRERPTHLRNVLAIFLKCTFRVCNVWNKDVYIPYIFHTRCFSTRRSALRAEGNGPSGSKLLLRGGSSISWMVSRKMASLDALETWIQPDSWCQWNMQD